MTRIRVLVEEKRVEAEGIASFFLRLPSGGGLPAFTPGAHIDVHIEPELIRQYSLCGPSEDRERYQIAVLNDPVSRGGSSAMHERVHAGDELWVSPPRNLFPLVSAKHVILFAGGIGITPLMSMAEELAANGAGFKLHYCTRSQSRMAFRERLGANLPAGSWHKHFDDGADAQKLDLSVLRSSPVEGTHIYVCGPTGFIEYVLGAARRYGWDESQLHVEYFGAQESGRAGDKRFSVSLANSGLKVDVPPDTSVTEALAAAGITIPTSCRNGVCGTCLTRVLEGVCDHRDIFLTKEEQALHNQFTPCCSRALSANLVLDL